VTDGAFTARLHRSGLLANWISSKIHGREVSSAARYRLSGACFNIALDHHVAIVTLLEKRLYASALALARPQFEAYVRASWLFNIAPIEWFQKPVGERFWLRLERMIVDLEKTDIFRDGQISTVYESSRFILNDFTHTGFQQIHRWNTNESIEQDYDVSELSEAVVYSDALALLTASGLAVLIDDETLALDILDQIKSVTK